MNGDAVALRTTTRSLSDYVSDHGLAASRTLGGTGRVFIDGTLGFYDISGFTTLTERLARAGRSGAEHINDVLNTVFTGLIDEVLRDGGDVLEFGGDAMVVLFDGDDHERRAARATARMFRFLSADKIRTPAGEIRLGMSCGLASGGQDYYLAGVTRRAFVVAGPVSTRMAMLESSARAGEALVDRAFASAVDPGWTTARRSDGSLRLRLDRVADGAGAAAPVPRRVLDAPAEDVVALLPTQFHSLLDGRHRVGELKQVAMSFIRLDGTDDRLHRDGADSLERDIRLVSEIVDRASADLDVCWMETQAEANSVRWTLIAGAPTATERDGERLLRVLCRIADESPFPLRIGANLGVVFVGDMGHPRRCTYIVMGDATNLAARLMARAAPGEIIAGERLMATCPGRFDAIALDPFPVKGKRHPVHAWSVSRLGGDDAEVSAGAAAVGAMIGREAELARLREAIAAGGVVDLVGEAGVGKTRLWHEARALEGGRTWLVTRAEPHETRTPFVPFGRLLRDAAGIDDRHDQHAAARQLTELVARVAPSLQVWLPLIAEVVGTVVPSTPQVDALAPEFRGERLQAAVAELVADLARPDGVLVVEDVHWADDGSRGIVENLARMQLRPVSLVLTRRPEGWAPEPATRVDVPEIDTADADELLLRELPPELASDAMLARLRESAAGNPLFLIELARSVASSPGPTPDAYPETVERLLAARIDRLSVAGRELIRDVSVLGSTVDRRLASRVLGRPELVASEVWADEVGDLLEHDDRSVRFGHDLVRVAAYEGLSVRRRKELHRRAGEVIERWGRRTPVADVTAALAYHASGSGIPERVVTWSRRAAESAIERGAMETAELLLLDVEAAQHEIGAGPADRCAVSRRLAVAAERAGHPESALAALGRAAGVAGEGERAWIAVDRARILEKLGRYRSALVTTARALDTCPDPRATGHLRLARATIRNFQGRWRECLEQCHQLLRDVGPSDDPRLVAQAHLLAEWCCTRLDLPERAEHERAALALLTELDDSIGLANLHLNMGESAWRDGRVVDAVADFRTSAERYERAGDVIGAALADNNLAEVLTLQSRLDEAEALLVRVNRLMKASSYPQGVLGSLSGLARIAAWRGDTERALHLQLEAAGGFRDMKADDLLVDSLVRLVEIHVIAGDAAAALTAADEAAAALRRLGDTPMLPSRLMRLRAAALVLAGRDDDARVCFDRALALAIGDDFGYEAALASVGRARLDGDDAAVAAAVADLTSFGIVELPPGV